MLSESEVSQFNERGFLNGGQLLDGEIVEELRNELARVIEERDREDVKQPVLCRNLNPNPETPVWQVVNVWEASEPFRVLLDNQKVVEEMAQLTGATRLKIWHDQIQYKPAETGGVNMWHQDAPLWPILAPMTEVSAWIALDDVDVDNGCMSMVPGSHLWGNQIAFIRSLGGFEDMPETFEGKEVEIVRCPVRKGEVHYHHALTWHGSHANTSDRPRRAIAIHYMTEETRFVASGEHVMKSFVTVEDGEELVGEHFPEVWGG
jgi:phytanoyl-CoA hydroxylase